MRNARLAGRLSPVGTIKLKLLKKWNLCELQWDSRQPTKKIGFILNNFEIKECAFSERDFTGMEDDQEHTKYIKNLKSNYCFHINSYSLNCEFCTFVCHGSILYHICNVHCACTLLHQGLLYLISYWKRNIFFSASICICILVKETLDFVWIYLVFYSFLPYFTITCFLFRTQVSWWGELPAKSIADKSIQQVARWLLGDFSRTVES